MLRSPRPVGTRQIRVDIPPDVHRLLRLAAAERDVSMACLAREILADHLKPKPAARPSR